MTLRFIEGFELCRHQTYIDRYYASTGGLALDLTNSGRRLGNSALNQISNPKPLMITKALSASLLNEWVLGFGFRCPSGFATASTNVAGFAFLDASAASDTQCVLYMDGNDDDTLVWKLARTNNWNLSGHTDIATSEPFDPAVWHYFELKVNIRTGTDGSYEMKMHDHYTGEVRTIMSGSGVNLAAQGTDGIDRLGITWRNSQNTYMFFDDIYLLDTGTGQRTDYLGEVVVLHKMPEGEGDAADWTPPSGANWENVDDSPLATEDGNYVDGDVGDQDLHVYQDLEGDVPDIPGVRLDTTMLLEAAGSETVGHRVRDADDNDNDGTSFTVDSTDPDTKSEVLEQDPETSADWTQARLDDTQFGYEREA